MIRTIKYLIEDFRIFRFVHPNKVLFNVFYLPCFRVVLLFRLSQLFYKSIVLIPLAYIFTILNDTLNGVWIGPRVEVGKGFYLGHPRGLVVNPNVKIGNYCSIIQQVTLGGPRTIIGDFVSINAGAKVISDPLKTDPVFVGNNSIIAAGAIVLSTQDESSVLAGIPAKSVKKLQEGENWITMRQKINKKKFED